MKSGEDLQPFFHPRSIALVGIPRGGGAGRVFLQGLIDQGYSGEIFPVNPQAEFIDGLRAYPSLREIPGEVDLAILLVPAQAVKPVLLACAEKKVKGVIIYTSGFGESGGEEGKRREEELRELGRGAGLRILGPNCMGIYHPQGGMAFFPGMPKEPGRAGMISQSGSLTILVSRLAEPQGVRFSKMISLGNECDLNSADLLQYLAGDTQTEVVAAYLEGVKNGPAFLSALKAACRRKPVVIWKSGRTPQGARAASSHTGSLAGSGMAWEALRKQTGFLLAKSLEDYLDLLTGIYHLPRELGKRMAILSGPGGPAVSATDACEELGLEVAELQGKTRLRLKEILPKTGTSANNPVDLGLASVFEVDLYHRAAEIVAEDPGVDAFLFMGRGAVPEENWRYAAGLAAARERLGKPFLAVSMGDFYLDPKARDLLVKAGIPVFSSAERALKAYAQIYFLGRRKWTNGNS